MDAHDLQQIVAACRPDPADQQALIAAARAGGQGDGGRRKLQMLSSKNEVDWMNWREHAVDVQQINRWDHARFRLEIAASMTGDAKNKLRGIPTGNRGTVPVGGGAPVIAPATDLLDAYERRFLPEAASDAAKFQFDCSAQREGEGIADWHGRVRLLFSRAHPEYNEAEVEQSKDLRQRFMLNLSNTQLKKQTFERRPDTFSESLATCLTQESVLMMLGLIPSNDAKGSLNAINPSGPLRKINPVSRPAFKTNAPDRMCYYCNKPGHYKVECRAYIAAKDAAVGGKIAPYNGYTPPAPRTGTSRGGGSRGGGWSRRGRGGRGGGGDRRRAVGAVGGEEEEEINGPENL